MTKSFNTKFRSLKIRATLSVLGTLSAACALVACGTKTADDVSQAGKNIAGEPGLQGKWTSSCGKVEALKTSGKSTYIFEPLKYEKNLMFYKDANCSEAMGNAKYKGEYKIGSGDDLEGGAKRIDLIPKTLTMSANTQAGVDALNLIKFCGISDWALNQERDVTNSANGGKCLIENMNESQYDIFTLNSDKLTFGSTFLFGAPTKEENRPKKVGSQTLVPAQ